MSKELSTTEPKKSVIEFMAGKYGMERTAFEAVIKETVMSGNVKNEEFVAFLSVAKEYDLNPLTKQIYAFAKGGKVFPIVPVDGWSAIINRNPQFDGMEFVDSVENGKLISIECKIYRKDRSKPISAIEYLEECDVKTNPAWKQWPRRMLRHKALIQAARYAFGLGGIYDPDEGEGIKEVVDVTPKPKTGLNVADLKNPIAATVTVEKSDAPTLKTHFHDQEEVQVEEIISKVVTDNSEVAEAIFKKISDGLKLMANPKAVSLFFEKSSAEDLELLKAIKSDYHAQLVSLKNQRLEALK